MASGIESSEVCVLACGVPLPIEVVVAPEFIGTVQFGIVFQFIIELSSKKTVSVAFNLRR